MRRLIVGHCAAENSYSQRDPDAALEAQFEASVFNALNCIYPTYRCIPFRGGFQLDNVEQRPDLALIAKDFSHWYVLEVELTAHSLEGHVLPQVRTLQYGTPLPVCASMLSEGLSIPVENARTLVDHVPRAVAVVANRRIARWEDMLAAIEVQLLTVAVFQSGSGQEAMEVDGQLRILKESLGFCTFSSADRSLRFPANAKGKLPEGTVQLLDPSGTPSLWVVSHACDTVWVTKGKGNLSYPNGSWFQLFRGLDGQLSLRSVRPSGPLPRTSRIGEGP
jgi:hypothetical protein